MEPTKYFAYGSNMLRERMIARGVVLLDAGKAAQLLGYRLEFNKVSSDGSSKANLMLDPGAITWGTAFTVDPSILSGLDAAEGAPEHYGRATVTVRTSDGEHSAMTYIAQPSKVLSTPDRPWDWYLALMLAGAKVCSGISNEWIAHLRHIGQSKPYSKDPPDKSFTQAVAQLKAAGYAQWQDLLIE